MYRRLDIKYWYTVYSALDHAATPHWVLRPCNCIGPIITFIKSLYMVTSLTINILTHYGINLFGCQTQWVREEFVLFCPPEALAVVEV